MGKFFLSITILLLLAGCASNNIKEKEEINNKETELGDVTEVYSGYLDIDGDKLLTSLYLTRIELDINGLNLIGEIIIPEVENKMPVVLIIEGSKLTNMNGNNYLFLAKELEKKGIASLRFNKSVISNNYDDLVVFDDFVKGATSFYKLLKEDDRFSDVYIIGYSQGALIAEKIAISENVSKTVSLAATGRTVDLISKTQVGLLLPEESVKGSKILAEESIQSFVISTIKVDPVEISKEIKKELLIITGEIDLRVSASEENITAYRNSDLPIHSELINILTDFFSK